MAEIKSTMEKVLERLAQMDAAGSGQKGLPDPDEKIKQGMRRAAEYMRKETASLASALAEHPPADQQHLRKGAVLTLLRNIVLPRFEMSEDLEQALGGLMELSGGAGDIGAVIAELKQILDRYQAHLKDLKNQLEESFRHQMEQAMLKQTGKSGLGMKMDPKMHPKFAEEWQRLQNDINDQYGRAIDQYKNLIAQRLGSV